MRPEASATWICPSGCFLVQPAPVTKRSLASGRMVCSSCFGARMPVTVVRGAGRSTVTCSIGVFGGLAGEWCVCTGIEKQEPGAGVAGENGFDALTIEPAGGFDGGCSADGCDVGIDDSAETMGYSCGDARETRA